MKKRELEEIKAYTKKQAAKLKEEGSTTAGVPGYLTPNAFVGDEDADGTTVDMQDDQFAYSIKASKKKPHFIKLHEVSYKAFKEDASMNEVQKVNQRILEVSKMLREISRSLDHSMKLKKESSLDESKYWKRTNEAILKISQRLSEINKKARKLANLKELAASSVKDKLVQIFNKANLNIKAQDIDYNQTGKEQYEFDVMLYGEPYAFDYNNGSLTYQDYDKEVLLGNLNQESEIIKQLTQIFQA